MVFPDRQRSPSTVSDQEDLEEGLVIEDHELAEKESRYSDDGSEQGDRLLPGGDGRQEKLQTRPSQSRSKRATMIVGVLGFGILGLMVLFDLWVLILGASSDHPTKPPPDPLMDTPFRRRSDEYILDSRWDFDAPRQVRRYNWTIVDKEGNPDGVFRPMMMIDGKFPGPLIEVNEGDTVVVDVTNRAKNATAIHWHGLFQNRTNWMDGTNGVTQCPIAPGSSFRYEFKVEGQSGTYFYHGHQGTQALDGLVGPFVVHSRDEELNQPMEYDTDRVVLLQDWYYDSPSGLLRQVLSPGNEDTPIPNTALLNGQNQVDCALHKERECKTVGITPLMDLDASASHRLRFINVGGFAWFQVSIDAHTDLPVIEIDGTEVVPASDSTVMIAPGQRYSIVLQPNATHDYEGYWLRARMVEACFSRPFLPENGVDVVQGMIRYVPPGTPWNDGDQVPTSESTTNDYAMKCVDMGAVNSYSPVPSMQAPAYAHHSWYLRVNLGIGDWRLQRGLLNSSSFRPNLKAPTLHRIVDGLSSQNKSFTIQGVNTQAFDPQEMVISHKGPEVVDIILQNFDEGNHPFHLHGHKFWVLGSGHGYFPGYENLGLAAEGKGLLDPSNSTIVENPLRRDVATAEGFGWVLLRFVADNPGVWLFHCHMIWHGEAGMAMQFFSRIDTAKEWRIPQANLELCNAAVEELEKGAAPKDEVFYGFHDD